MSEAVLPFLPPAIELETKPVLRKLTKAHRYLAELKGVVGTIPNEGILINTLTLQEAKDSSEIENIITTHDELYKSALFEDVIHNLSAKEVRRYATALRAGFAEVRKTGLITTNLIVSLYQELEQNDGGIRRQSGTTLQNDKTGEIIYTPPQSYDEIVALMTNLEQFINDGSMLDVDPLVKMAIIHHQFESIHPFYDGNGRAGRIINILYLVAQGLLDIPILYLSGYIIQTKQDYYRLLQDVRDSGSWQEWLIYILDGIEVTSRNTIRLVTDIKDLMQDYKHRIRVELPKIYSQELLNNLFSHPYTKIEYMQHDLNVSRLTAGKYLSQLTEQGFVKKQKIGRYNYYINEPLFKLFTTLAV
ncbi:MAG: addiction module protein [Methylophaga sp.]|nr:MAG: addiction module protein [Methylophaga sp.]